MRLWVDIPDEDIQQIPSATYARETAKSNADEITNKSGLLEITAAILSAVEKGHTSAMIRVPSGCVTKKYFDAREAQPGEAFLSARGLLYRDLLVKAGYTVSTFVSSQHNPHWDVFLAMKISWNEEEAKS